MHGSALAHMFQMSIGVPGCCAVVELFPDEKFGYSDILGFANIARNLGIHYYKYQAKDDTATEIGTIVDEVEIVQLVTLLNPNPIPSL
jgi:hypothetical protein